MGIAFKRGKTVVLLGIGNGKKRHLTVTTSRKDAATGAPMIIVRDDEGQEWYVLSADTTFEQALEAARPDIGVPRKLDGGIDFEAVTAALRGLTQGSED